jgi:hypothetical protein
LTNAYNNDTIPFAHFRIEGVIVAKRNELQKEERISREESIALIDNEIENRNVSDLTLKGASVVTTISSVSMIIAGVNKNKLYMFSISALVALGGLLLCKASMNHSEKTGYLKAVSAFLKANNGKGELEGFEPAVLSFSDDDNNPLKKRTGYERKRFLVKD